MACGMSTHCPCGGLRRGERLLAGLGPPPPACLITVGLDAADEFRWPLFCPSPCVSSLFSRQLPLLLYGKKSHLFFSASSSCLGRKEHFFCLENQRWILPEVFLNGLPGSQLQSHLQVPPGGLLVAEHLKLI